MCCKGASIGTESLGARRSVRRGLCCSRACRQSATGPEPYIDCSLAVWQHCSAIGMDCYCRHAASRRPCRLAIECFQYRIAAATKAASKPVIYSVFTPRCQGVPKLLDSNNQSLQNNTCVLYIPLFLTTLLFSIDQQSPVYPIIF